MCPYAVEICFDLLLQIPRSTSGNWVHFDFLLSHIHSCCNCAHIHNSNRFRFIVATCPRHKLQLYHLTFFIGAQPTHAFICVATIPRHTVVINLDLLLQLAYGTSCN
jgi:hypothetical protein